MAILIKNPETERKARELAARKGQSITGAIDAALDRELAATPAVLRKPTLEEAMAATERFRKAVGLEGVKLNATRETFDALWEDDEPGGDH
jgi:antitoxin VapB